MFKRLLAVAGVSMFLSASAFAANAATVVVKDTDKTAKAKVGDTFDIEIPNPALASMKKDFKVDESGSVLGKATTTDENHMDSKGKPLAGGGYKSIKIKATAKGTEKVKVMWMQDGKAANKEFEFTVE